ncbi:MAG: trehalose-6-phosphate synthase [Firmicutes bacterium]|nr:trehalose-6-phosphate synthase [Bacillota bacterium]
MSDLMIVANRSPVRLSKNSHGGLSVHHSIGGVAPSLVSALQDQKADWVATALSEEDIFAAKEAVSVDIGDINVNFVVLPPDILELSYNKIANEVFWFLCHGLFNAAYTPVFDKSFFAAWEAYRLHNEKIADAICEGASYGAKVIVNDYHFFLVGKYLKIKRPDLETTYFLHIPFPTLEELHILPSVLREELLRAMSAYGSCGFHTQRWCQRYQKAVSEVLGIKPKAYATPLGVDPVSLRHKALDGVVRDQAERLSKRFAGKKIIYRTDRLEPSKNLIRGFLAFEELLVENPSLRAKTVFFARTYLSREKSKYYQTYKKEVFDEVARINQRFGGDDVIEFVTDDNYELSLAGMLIYDVLLVNPVRDGMNLVAKEGVAVNPKEGLLILSQEAGAYEEMRGGALGVNPYDVSETANAMKKALEMDNQEKSARNAQLSEVIMKNPPALWLSELLEQAI